KPDRRHYLRGVLKLEQDEFIVYTTGPQGSGILSSMSMANCLIVVPKDKTYLPIGESVTCEIIDASW
ncbi:MAG: molybdopterin molybdenumtransferase MoeA, partial [Deltaproteobacteria bacterium]